MSNSGMLGSSNACVSNDLSCVLHNPWLCEFASQNSTDKIFGGNMTQTIIQIFNEVLSLSGGFCSLPKIQWNKNKFMVLEGGRKGLIDGIKEDDVPYPFMVGYDSDYNRLFLTIKTEPSVVTVLFQKQNDFRGLPDDTWFIGGGEGGPFEFFFPYFSFQQGCVSYLRELVKRREVTISYMRQFANSNSSATIETKTFYLED